MKNYIYIAIPVFISIFLGTIFMDVSKDGDTIPVMSDTSSLNLFQPGSDADLEVAEKEASLKKGITLKIENNYHVYIGILKNPINIERMISYLDEKNIYYYIKDINLDPVFLEVLNKYEDLMLSSNSSVAFFQLNKKILERYKILYES